MKRYPVLVLAAILAAVGVACVAHPVAGASPDPARRALTLADSGTSITLRVGESVEVALDANGTAGYAWVVRAQDENLLATEEKTFTPRSDLPGSPGTDVRRLRAKTPGGTRLEMVLCRPWECDATVSGRFDLGVRIVPANDCGCPSRG